MSKKQQGFTIIELLIATTVFSVVMVLCLSAFLRVGQLYYKGIYLSRTQESARDVSDDIVGQLRLNGNPTGLQKAPTQINGHDVYFMCAGSKRYSFMSNNVVDTENEANNNFGLVRDSIPGIGCVPPVGPQPSSPLVNPTELLNDKMRVVANGTGDGQSDINEVCLPSAHTICSIHVHVDFGDDDLLVNPADNVDFTHAPPLSQVPGGNCSGPLGGSQFCATTDIDTTILPLQ